MAPGLAYILKRKAKRVEKGEVVAAMAPGVDEPVPQDIWTQQRSVIAV